MKAKLEYKSGSKPIIYLEAEDDDEKHPLQLMFHQGVHVTFYNGDTKLAITCGPGDVAE